jgi:UDPglucose--hexose-1-phosphate uridylyltransferase
MSELRWNPLLSEWVITATERQDRTFLPPREHCPLCPSKPGGQPTEIDRATFEVAVFENRFPSLHRSPPQPAVAGTDLTPVRPAAGVCEVVVYTPEHDATLASLPRSQIEHLVGVWAHRTSELGARPEVEYVYAFENKGEAIGVTLHHPHGQIYAYPFLPPMLQRETSAAEQYRLRHDGCLWCDLADQERGDGRRIVIDASAWQASVPFAARWPYEVHVTPRRHVGWLHELARGEISELAGVLKRLLTGYDGLFGFSLPYVMAIHQRPTGGSPHPGYHLHLEFYPPHRSAEKLKYLAGSEAGAGVFINDTLPEETAARLRDALPS